MDNKNDSGSSPPQVPSLNLMPPPPNVVRYGSSSSSQVPCLNTMPTPPKPSSQVPGSLQIPGVSGDAILCRDAVNVKIDKSRGWYINNLPVVCFHCRGCNTTLGEKFFLNENGGGDRDRILEWNGSQLCHAHTHEPVQETQTSFRMQFLQGKNE
ncbi:hypothetical protein GOBAR_AA27785 [Gossypium barbadense]|uniref:Yippee domain-containing protein n=1 Tax=Gossypium barbadense TaxID=3634 RepID=A0A2P5WP74_GOSBA|nr:hypothetical protein GOBAR_AA27785 [Gossypium barbadense]